MWTDRMIERRMHEDGYGDDYISDFLAERADRRRELAREDAYDEARRKQEARDRQQMLLDRTHIDPFKKVTL